jgi:DNA-binding MarR family transcriptional regulator
MLLGTATTKFSELENVDRAWFELFTTHELKPLNTKDSLVLWKSYTGTKPPLRQVQALRILTGGNPRLFRILSDFATKASLRELMENLTRLIDEHTEYFKGSLDSLSALERKVFVALLERWDPSDARDIAGAARLDVSKTSALLHRLVAKGRVTTISVLGRKRKYQAAERLFNICYLMRRRGRPADRVRAVVRFMVQFYREDLAFHQVP